MTVKKDKIKTYAKADIVSTILDALKQENQPITKPQGEEVIEAFLRFLEDNFALGKAVSLTNYGRLTPYFKPGGRPVRNPKTLQPMIMPDTVNVRLNGHKSDVGRTATSELVDHIATIISHDQAKIAVKTIIGVLQQTKTGELRIEIRLFGCFAPRWRNERQGRNPSNGDKVITPGKYVGTFKISKPLRERLTIAMKANGLAYRPAAPHASTTLQ